MAGYSINISSTQTIVTATSNVNNIGITAYDQLFTITNTVQVFSATSVLQTTTIYTDAIELLVDDFANYFRGDWISGTTYRRGELVNNRYSLFVCSTGTLTTVTSTINPSDYTNTLSWTRVVWNEAPRNHLTVTNYLDVGTTATISGNTNIGGNLGVTGNAGITGNLDVTGTTHLAGLLTMDTPLDHLTVTNAVLIGGELRARDLIVDTTSTLNGTLTVAAVTTLNGSLTANQASTFNGSLTANQAVTFNNTANLNGVNTLSTASFTKSVDIAHNLQVLGITTSGSLIVTNNALVSGNLTVTNTATILGSLNVGDITGNGGVSIAGSLTVNGVSTFNTATFNRPVTFNATATFNEPTTYFVEVDTDRLKVANLLYPLTTGSFGQVIANMGDNTAQWRNLGDLRVWSLNDNLRTNGFNIITGGTGTEGLNIIDGLNTSNYASKISLNNVDISLNAAGSIILNSENHSTLELNSGNAVLRGPSRTQVISNTINLGAGTVHGFYNSFNGTTDYLRIGNPGIEFSDGTRLNTSLPNVGDVLPIATTSTLGGIKVGARLTIDPITGVLEASNQAPPQYVLPIATTSTLGGIRVGPGLDINPLSGVLYVTSASGSTGIVNLTNDLYTNGYKIKYDVATAVGIDIDYGGITVTGGINANGGGYTFTGNGFAAGVLLEATGQYGSVRLLAEGNGVDISGSSSRVHAQDIVKLEAPEIDIGYQTTGTTRIGELRVNKIYNYAGSYAPFFPAGIQLADSTVQVTAYFPDGGPLPLVV